MNERTQFFRKIYLSHFILERVAKRLILVMCERWVGNRTDCNILTPSSSDYSSTSSSFCWAAQLGSWGPKPSVWSWFSLPWTPTNWFQLTQDVCGTWLYNCLTPTCSCVHRNFTKFNSSIGQGDTSISSTGCTYFLIDGWVEGQYVTPVSILLYGCVTWMLTKPRDKARWYLHKSFICCP